MSMSVTMKPAVHDLLVCRLQSACWCVRRRARWTSCCGKPTCRWWWARRHGGNSSLKPSPSALVVWLHTQTSSSSTTLFVSLFHITDQSTHTLKEFLPRDAMQCGTCCRHVSIRLSVCPPKPVLYRNIWTNRAGFWHGGCVIKKFGYLQN